MGVIRRTYETIDTSVSFDVFRIAVDDQIEQTDGEMDKETAASYIADELREWEETHSDQQEAAVAMSPETSEAIPQIVPATDTAIVPATDTAIVPATDTAIVPATDTAIVPAADTAIENSSIDTETADAAASTATNNSSADAEIEDASVDTATQSNRDDHVTVDRSNTELIALNRDCIAYTPSVPSVQEYLTVLDAGSQSTRRTAIEAIMERSKADAENARAVVDELASLLADSDDVIRTNAARTLRYVAEEYPGDVRPVVTRLQPLLEDDENRVRFNVVWTLRYVSKAYPEDVRPALRALGLLFTAQQNQLRYHATATVSLIAEEFPEDVRPAVGELQPLLEDTHGRVRKNAARTLANIADEYPAAVRPAIPGLYSLLDDTHKQVRTTAAVALSEIATAYPDAVRPAVAKLRSLRDHRQHDADGKAAQKALDRLTDAGRPRDDQSNRSRSTNGNGEYRIDDGQIPEDTEYVTTPPELDFSDVAGMADLKETLRNRVIEPLANPERFEKYGLSVENGFLLYGPPGTGKSYICKALAGELGINYARVRGTNVISTVVGEAPQNISELFAEARRYQPCLVFIDEIDALTPERNSSSMTQNQTTIVNTFLEEIGEINAQNHDVVILTATNCRSKIDDAMLRSGRLSIKIEVPPPDAEARWKIFDHHLDAPRDDGLDSDLETVGELSTGLTAADMEQVATTAARKAMHRGDSVTLEDVQTAIDELNSTVRSMGEYVTTPPELDFSDVAGMADLKETLRNRVIEPLEKPEVFEEYGLSVENGVLLYGPPGTGKSYISKALAGELGINYANVKGTDLISNILSEGPQNVSELFEEARQQQPCLVFIDEIDALTPERRSANQHQEQTTIINTFLTEISDINENDLDVVLVAATNRRDKIDDAMLRSGRLSTKVEVSLPDRESRQQIFDHHLDAPRAETLDLDSVGELSDGLSAADMEQVATTAARKAMQRGDEVGLGDVSSTISELIQSDREQSVGSSSLVRPEHTSNK